MGNQYLAHSIASAQAYLEQSASDQGSPSGQGTQGSGDAYAAPQGLRELLASIDVSPPLIEGLLNRGQLLMLFAPTGVGKTIYAQNLCAYTCAGERVFEVFPVSGQLRCLYVNFEMSDREVGLRFTNMFDALGKGEENLMIKSFSDFDITKEKDRRWLFEQMAKLKPDILVLDPLEAMHHMDENEARGMGLVIQPLREMAQRYNCGVVVVHHARGEQYDARGRVLPRKARGSTIIQNKMDTMLELLQTDDPLITRLHFWKTRSVTISRKEDLVLKYDEDTYLLKLIDDPQMRERYAQLNVERHRYLQPLLKLRAVGWKRNEIADAVGVDPSEVSHWQSGRRTPSAQHQAKFLELIEHGGGKR